MNKFKKILMGVMGCVFITNLSAAIGNEQTKLKPENPLLIQATYYFQNSNNNPHYKNEALRLLKQTAQEGDAKAQTQLYYVYSSDNFVAQDDVLAEYWLNKAIEQSFEDAIKIRANKLYENGFNDLETVNKVITLLMDLANKNSSDAMMSLSHIYLNNDLVKNQKIGLSWLEKSRNLGNANAEYFTAAYYFKGLYLPLDNKKGLEWMLKAADHNNAYAQNQLGLLYVKGRAGLKEDKKQARYWFEKSANNGYRGAIRNIGMAYKIGDLGYPKDNLLAIAWLTEAARSGHVNAMLDMAEIYMRGEITPKDPEKELEWRLSAIKSFSSDPDFKSDDDKIDNNDKISEKFLDTFKYDANYAKAINMYRISELYKENNQLSNEVKNDLVFKWMKKSAEANLSEAQFALAGFYLNGTITTKNPNQAFEWMEKAALLGNMDAEHTLYIMYTQGIGVQKNNEKAIFYLKKAAEHGMGIAQYNLGVIAAEGILITKDLTLAAKWFEKSAAQGFPDAQNNLGFMYFEGIYLQKNCEKAFDLFNKSATQGEVKAVENLKNYYSNGKCIQPDEKLAQFWREKRATMKP